MSTRMIGSLGLSAFPLGVGCMGLASESYGPADEKESVATIRRALDLGLSMLDTSDAYGPYISEEIVGKAVAGRREKALIATKFGIVPNDHAHKVTDGHAMAVNGRPEYVRQACDASLRRLGIDHIDLYYQHRVDPDVPIEDTIGALAELVDAGKVRYLGLSEARAQTIERANAVHEITAVQAEYSLWSRDVEDEILPLTRRLGIGVVAYSPLGRGFLSGRIRSIEDLAPDDYRRVNPRFMGANFVRNLSLLAEVERLAEERECTPAQLALAWVLSRGEDIVAIPGVQTRSQLEENVGAVSIELTAYDIQQIERAFPKDAAAGERYPTAHMP